MSTAALIQLRPRTSVSKIQLEQNAAYFQCKRPFGKYLGEVSGYVRVNAVGAAFRTRNCMPKEPFSRAVTGDKRSPTKIHTHIRLQGTAGDQVLTAASRV